MADRYELRLPALRIRQGAQFIYTFGVDGKRIHDFATVSRVHRDDITLQGYQRPEVLSHIRRSGATSSLMEPCFRTRSSLRSTTA